MVNAPKVLASLKAKAAEQMAEWQQYDGHFDNRVLVRIDRDVTTKAGLAFEANEYAIMKPDLLPNMSGYVTVWSMRNTCDTLVPRIAVQHIIERSRA